MKIRNPLFILYVHDMDRAVAFYSDGLGLVIISRSPGWSTLDCGGAILALHILGTNSEETTTGHAGLNLEIDDIEAGIRKIEAAGGHLRILTPADEFVPDHVAELVDTEGNVFELRQPAGDVA